MKRLHLLVSIPAISLLSMTAMATNLVHPNQPTNDHVYFEGNLGYARVGAPNQNVVGGSSQPVDAETGNVGAGVNVGYDHALNKTVALGGEVGYDYNGFSDVKTTIGPTEHAKIFSHDFHLMLTSDFHINQSPLDLFAKAGVARVTQSMEDTSNNQNIDDKTEFTPITTVGLGYMLSPRVNMHLQYTHIFGNTPSQLPASGTTFGHVNSVDALSLGSSYQFGV